MQGKWWTRGPRTNAQQGAGVEQILFLTFCPHCQPPPGRTGKNCGLLFEPLLLPKTLNATCTLCRVW